MAHILVGSGLGLAGLNLLGVHYWLAISGRYANWAEQAKRTN